MIICLVVECYLICFGRLGGSTGVMRRASKLRIRDRIKQRLGYLGVISCFQKSGCPRKSPRFAGQFSTSESISCRDS